MNWIVTKGYSDKHNVTVKQYWETVSSWLGLREGQYQAFLARHYGNYVNGRDLKPGYIREMEGSGGSIHYLKLEEYNSKSFTFTISLSTEYLDQNSKYMIIRNAISEIEGGSRWDIQVSEKSRSIIKSFLGKGKYSENLDGMFHGHIHFTLVR